MTSNGYCQYYKYVDKSTGMKALGVKVARDGQDSNERLMKDKFILRELQKRKSVNFLPKYNGEEYF